MDVMSGFGARARLVLGVGALDAVVFLGAAGHPGVQAVALLAPIGAATVLAVRGVWISGRATAGLSVPLAAGMACYLAAAVPWCLYPLLSGAVLPVPSVVDVLFIASYLLFGVFLLRWTARLASVDRRGALDGVIVAVGASPALWAGLLAPGPRLGVDAATVTLLLYPTATLVSAAVALRLVFVVGVRTRLHLLCVAWISLELAGDVGYALEGVRGSFTFGESWQVSWVLSSVALAALIVHGRDQTGRVPLALSPILARPPIGGRRLPILGAALVVPAVVLAMHGNDGGVGLSAFAALLVVIVLVLVRLSGLMVDLVQQRSERDALVRLSGELERQATHDSLTGLANRALLVRAADHALAQRARVAERGVGLILLDLDDFKTINDTLGHEAGDRLLVVLAARLRALCRHGDTVARLGGDEFVLLVDDTDLAQLVGLAARVIERLNAPEEPGEPGGARRRAGARASAGLALALDGQDHTALLAQADAAMYAAKAAGGNGYAVFDPAAHSALRTRQQLERDLREALSHDQLRLEYQPVIDLVTGEITGAEALMRWDHPHRGAIGPDEFIPVAEASGSINTIGEWALRSACEQLRRWDTADPALAPLRMAVNLSRRQLNPDLVAIVARVLHDTGLAPHRLLLEITETALSDPATPTITHLRQLKELGCGLAIDDFGTGYSSLAELRTMPFDIIKVDKSFVAGIAESTRDLAVTTAILQLAHSLHRSTIAEGIETGTQLARLQSLGCQQGQGYLFSRPVSPEQFRRLRSTSRPTARQRGDDQVDDTVAAAARTQDQ